LRDVLRFEAEAEWPPIRQTGGYFEPVHATGTCASGGRMMAIRPTGAEPFEGTLSFPVPREGRFRITVRLVSRGDVQARLAWRQSAADPPLATWSFASSSLDWTCATLAEQDSFSTNRGLLEIIAPRGGELAVDAVHFLPKVRGEATR
jgi:hypothetical protein